MPPPPLKRPPPTRTSRFLTAFNVFTGTLGLVFIFASFYARTQVPENGWSGLVGKNVSMLGVVAGMMTLLMSLVGCAAANSQSRPALCCYLCVFATVWSVQIAATVGMTTYSGQLSMKNENVPSGSLTSYTDIQIQNAAFSVYQRCCTGCPSLQCNNPYPDSYVNYSMPNCLGQVQCVRMFPCTNSTQAKCFKYGANEPVIIPPYPVDGSICSSMSSLKTTNPTGQTVLLIGPADAGGCGGGDPTTFLKNLDSFVMSSLNGVAVVFILVILAESFVLPVGLYLAITGGNRYRRDDEFVEGAGPEEDMEAGDGGDRDEGRAGKGRGQVDII